MSLVAYPQYCNSGIRWIGEVPVHWRVGKTKFFAELRSGHTPSRSRLDFWVDCTIPWFSLADVWQIRDGKRVYLIETKEKISEVGLASSAAELLPTGTVIVSRTASVGFSGIMGIPMATTQDFVNWVPGPRLNSHFLLFVFRAMEREFDLLKMGSTHKTIYMPDVRQFTAPLPPLEEQSQIVKFLDYETAKIDALIEKQQRLIALLKEKRQAVISHAVTKGLNPDVPMRDSGVEWLGEVPAHWRVGQLRRWINEMEKGKSPECESRPAEEREWGVLKTGCVNGGIYAGQENKALPLHLAPAVQYEVQAGDVLMSRASGSTDLIGSVAYVSATRPKVLLSDKIFRLHLGADSDAQYFTYLMASTYMRSSIVRAISGADGMANNITKASVLGFRTAFPPVSEQRAIVGYIEKTGARLFSLAENASSLLEILKERRTALISAAVTGKIDVRGWKPPESRP